jgi:hypothetical protein
MAQSTGVMPTHVNPPGRNGGELAMISGVIQARKVINRKI